VYDVVLTLSLKRLLSNGHGDAHFLSVCSDGRSCAYQYQYGRHGSNTCLLHLIGQFFNEKKVLSYLLAFTGHILVMISFWTVAALTGTLIDKL